MANRILRDITDSEKVNKLSWQSEVLFYRLFMKADDYGSLYSNPKLIKGGLYPLKECIRETDIIRYLDELQKAELIILYQAENKGYLQILEFGQKLRRMVRKYPKPSESDLAKVGKSCPPEKKLETNPNQETESEIIINSKIQHVLDSEVWLQNLARIEKITTEKALECLVYFLESQKNKEEIEHRDLKELKNHFANWLTKNKEKNSAKKENGNTTNRAEDAITSANDIAQKRGWA